MILTKDESKRIIDKVLSLSKAQDCEVSVNGDENVQTRFANNSITTSGRHNSASVSISVTNKEKRSGSTSLTEFSDEALRAAVAKAEELASLSPPDGEYIEPLGPQQYPDIASFDAATAKADHASLIPGVKSAVAAAEAKKLQGSGYYTVTAVSRAFGNSKGNFAYGTRTSADLSVTARTADGTGSGWATGESNKLSDIPHAELARIAAEKSVLSQNPRKLDAGKYTVVLEPAAVRDLVGLIGGAFNARNAEEGRSFMSKRGGGTRVGEKLFSEKVTLRSDPFDPRNPGLPWGGGGGFGGGGGGGNASSLPSAKMTWIEKGVVKNLSYNRYWAMRKNVAPTTGLGSLILEGEENSLEDLIKSTEKGLLVTHFWYIRSVNPQTLQFTGLTRDGVFMIENGKIAYPVNNFRWNESPSNLLANVEMMSRPQRTNGMLLPAMKVKDFNMSSISDAV
ncbi:MAG: TldD/PmbA family protein [Terriglobales bacterium]